MKLISWHKDTAVDEEYDTVTGELITDMPEPEAYDATDGLETELLVPDPVFRTVFVSSHGAGRFLQRGVHPVQQQHGDV